MLKKFRLTALILALILSTAAALSGCADVMPVVNLPATAEPGTSAPTAQPASPPPSPAPTIPPYLAVSQLDTKEVGITESLIEYGENIVEGVHYPLLGDDPLDRLIQNRIAGLIADFKQQIGLMPGLASQERKIELNIDYESFLSADRYVSICFYISIIHPDLKNSIKSVSTLNLDLQEKKELSLSDVFKPGAEEALSEIIKQKIKSNPKYIAALDESVLDRGAGAQLENFQNFALQDSRLAVYFEEKQILPSAAGIPLVAIPYEDIAAYIAIPLIGYEEYQQPTPRPIPSYPAQPLSERRIDPEKPMVALTFDDGPKAETTNRILDTLEQYGSVATFFILGVQAMNNASVIQRMVVQQCELGNHTYGHKQLTGLMPNEIYAQIVDTQNAIAAAAGYAPTLLRPPYGSVNDEVRKYAGMPLILWSIDTEDWKSLDANSVIDAVMGSVKDGDIILMHDIYDSTADAAAYIVPALLSQGYQLVTVSELLRYSKGSVEAGAVYRHG